MKKLPGKNRTDLSKFILEMDEDTYQIIRNDSIIRNSYRKLLYKLMKSSNRIVKEEITCSEMDFTDNNIESAFRWSGSNFSSAPPKHFIGATIVSEEESHFETKVLRKKTSSLEEFTLESSNDRPCKRRKKEEVTLNESMYIKLQKEKEILDQKKKIELKKIRLSIT